MFFLFFFFVYFSFFLGRGKQECFGKAGVDKGGKENRKRCAGSIGAQRKNEYLMMISLYRLQIDGSRRCWLFFSSSSSGYGNRRTISFSFCVWLSPRATWQHLSLMMPSAIRRASWPRAPSLFIASLSWLYTLERKEDFCGSKPMGKRHSAVVRFKSEGAQLGQLG